MSNLSTDRNLLFGLIAMQNGLITREYLMTATGLWLQDKSQPMDQLLVSQEFITQQQHGLLSELVTESLQFWTSRSVVESVSAIIGSEHQGLFC